MSYFHSWCTSYLESTHTNKVLWSLGSIGIMISESKAWQLPTSSLLSSLQCSWPGPLHLSVELGTCNWRCTCVCWGWSEAPRGSSEHKGQRAEKVLVWEVGERGVALMNCPPVGLVLPHTCFFTIHFSWRPLGPYSCISLFHRQGTDHASNALWVTLSHWVTITTKSEIT